MDDYKNRAFLCRLRFALAGLAHGLSTERSLKTQVAVFALVILAMGLLRPAPIWWALVALASAAVLATELLNTAIEHLSDRLHPEEHPDIRIVKDCAAAAVLISVLGAGAVAAALVTQLCLHHA